MGSDAKGGGGIRGRAGAVGGSAGADGGVEVGVGDDLFLFGDAVLALRFEDVAGGEALVEEAEAGAENGDGRLVLWTVEGPRGTETGGEVGMVGHAGLGFEAQTIAERYVGTDLVVVFAVEAHVEDVDDDAGMAGGLGEEAGATAGGANLCGR